MFSILKYFGAFAWNLKSSVMWVDDPKMMCKKKKSKQTILWKMQSTSFTERLFSPFGENDYQEWYCIVRKGLRHCTERQVRSTRAPFWTGDSAEGRSFEIQRSGLRGELGFLCSAAGSGQMESASVLGRQLPAEMCSHSTFSLFWLELTSYRIVWR